MRRSSRTIQPRTIIKSLHRIKDFGSDRTRFVRLDKNERTIPFPEKVYRGMMKMVSGELLPIYPDQTPLYRKLSAVYNLPDDHFLLSAGSDAALKMIYETYLERGQEVLFLDPTYAMVEVYAEMFGAVKKKIKFGPDLSLDFPSLIRSIGPRTRMVILANPNQPTGTILTEKQLRQLLVKTRTTRTLTVLDEAYQPFSGQASAMRYVREFGQLVVMQTFSKASGLAAMRLGFVVSQPRNLEYLYRVKSHSDINLFALKLGEYLLSHQEIVADYVEEIKKSKRWLTAALSKVGLPVYAGYANFVHIRFPENYGLEKLAETLKHKGYLVRIAGKGMPAVLDGCMRITLGTLKQMKAFSTLLKNKMSSLK